MRARWYRADLLDQAARRQLIAAVRPQALLHCAWETTHGVYWTSPANLDWVAASLDLARAAAALGTRRILMVGTCAEYDWRAPPARPWREGDSCRPASLYGTAKDALHRVMAAFAGDAKISLVWARLFHLYGPQEPPARLVPGLLAALLVGQRAETGPANATRDFMHVADAGRALAHLLAGNLRGPVNVASGRPVTIGALAGILARLAGRPDLLAVGAQRSGEPLSITADTARLRATGFAASIALEDGLAALWKAAGGVVRPAPPPDYDQAARLFRADRQEEALAAVEAVLERDPDLPAALNLRGVLFRQRGDFARARPYLERAASLDPKSETAWVNLGNVHLDMENADAAVDAYTRAWTVAPARTDTLRLLGNALARAGRDADAMERLDQAVAAAPASTATLRDRARTSWRGGSTRRWRTLTRRFRPSRTMRTCCWSRRRCCASPGTQMRQA
jgi:nucleoside-diphosphate-sugar epimerase